MLEKARFDAVMKNLIARSLKKNYGQSPERFGDLLLAQHEHQLYIQYKNNQKKEEERLKRIEDAKEAKRRKRRGLQPLPEVVVKKKKSKKAIAAPTIPDVTFKDMNYSTPAQLIGWIFGRRPSPTYPVSLSVRPLYYTYMI